MKLISILNDQFTWSPILSVNMFHLLIDRNYLRVCFIDRFGELANGTPKPTSPGLGEAKISEEERGKRGLRGLFFQNSEIYFLSSDS